MSPAVITRYFGIQAYSDTYNAMYHYTETRTNDSPDQIWLGQHEPVFTQGTAGKPEHLLRQTDIPVIQSDRGGQITYHGPGQLIVYLMLDLKRKQRSVRELVSCMEQTVINVLYRLGINANARDDAPGVYVDGAKISSLGLRVKRGFTFHGLALNVDMDLAPFNDINPCGYAGMKMVNVTDFCPKIEMKEIELQILTEFCQQFDYQLDNNNAKMGV